jgi:hypothetical protein
MSTPRPAAIWLLATLAATAATVAAFLFHGVVTTELALTALTALFATRVAGQLAVLAAAPSWLPPMDEWNFVPYRFLLPVQLVVLALMTALATADAHTAPAVGWTLVALSFAYWGAMAARYAIRMTRRPEARWLGGTIPIVFHCVLAAFVFVLGVSYTA